MHVLIVAAGSAGDVYPFIGIGQALRSRGHEVELMCTPVFAARVAAAGLGFVPFGSEEDHARLLALPDLWHPRRGFALIAAELLRRLPAAHAALVQRLRPDTVMVGSTLAWNVRLAQETHGRPAATVHLSPSCLASAVAPAVLPGLGDVGHLPPWLLRPLMAAAERALVDRRIAPRLNSLRATLGLAPVTQVASRWMHSPDLVVGAWPDWFAPRAPDWPPQTVTTGFVRLAHDEGLPDTLEAFLRASSAPVGITPGSAMAHGARFLERALAACKALGRRAVLVTPYAGQVPAGLEPWAHHSAYVPFEALVPRLAALVHHGGIGTSAQALAAGVPQLVLPFAHDQFDNAARLQRLGVARKLGARQGAAAWREALTAMLGDAAAGAACRLCAERMAAQGDASAAIASHIERLDDHGAA